jgi:hypothetical protein
VIGAAFVSGELASSAQPQSPQSLRSYLSRTAALTDADLSALERGRPVAKAVPTRNNAEIYLLGVIRIDASPADYLARMTDPSRLETMPGYRGVGRITGSTTVADLTGYTLDPEDVEDLRDCRPGDCALQLPAASMPAASSAARNSAPVAAGPLNTQFRTIALDLVRDYRTRGNAALPVYHDEPHEAHARERLRALVVRLETLALLPSALVPPLIDFNGGDLSPDIQSLFYWEKIVFGLKPTLRVLHAMAFAPEPSSGLTCAVGIKQLYASHYLRAAIDFSACVPAPDSYGRRGFYLVSVTGSQQEGVTGFTGSIVRRVAVGRARGGLEGALTRIKDALEKR